MPLILLLLVLLGGCGREPRAGQPIFRHFNTELSAIRLGQAWTAEEVPGAEPGDTVIALPSGTFERAQAVRVHRTPDGVVSSIMFDYPQSADFQTMEREYRRMFGTPVEHVAPRKPGLPERFMWQDSVTRFELVRDPKRSAATVYTRLSDRPAAR